MITTKQKFSKQFLSIVLCLALLLSYVPVTSLTAFAAEDETTSKTIAGLGTGIIADPTVPTSTSDAWQGSYVYFGTYNGSPVKYRVLDSNTTVFDGTTMLLDCDSILWAGTNNDNQSSAFDSNSKVWADSDIRTYLNGTFLTGNFTTLEQKAIASSTKSAADSSDGAGWSGLSYVSLAGEKIFFLDAKEVTNESYGYSNTDAFATNRKKEGGKGYWWLRSASAASDPDNVGSISSSGLLDRSCGSNNNFGVSPALNVNLSSVLFSSVISGTVGGMGAEYKLTLVDSDITLASSGAVTKSDDTITVQYTISGDNGANATQVSVLILDKEYEAGNSNGAAVLAYGALDDNGNFTLPTSLSDKKCGTDYYAYIVAEDVNGTYETDYASEPVPITVPSTPNALSVTAFATPSKLMTAFDLDGTDDTVGKISFGANGLDAIEWYIAGTDAGIDGNNIVLFAVNSFGNAAFGSSMTDYSYDSSQLRTKLQELLANHFTSEQQALINTSAVETYIGSSSVSTTDKLYALTGSASVGSDNHITAGTSDDIIVSDSYWGSDRFWLRNASYNYGYYYVNYADSSYGYVNYAMPDHNFGIKPAANVNLSSVLFASAASAGTYGTIEDGTAMTLRLDADKSDKAIGSVFYDENRGIVFAEADEDSASVVYLVIQGNNGEKDWSYSKEVEGQTTVSISDIKKIIDLKGYESLSDCKIWIETTDGSEMVTYAKMATAGTIGTITQQPTKDNNYTVEVDPSSSAKYQWYTEGAIPITTDNASTVTDHGYYYSSYDTASGTWKAHRYYEGEQEIISLYFKVALLKGDVVTAKTSAQLEGNLYFSGPQTVSPTYDSASGIYTFTVPSDGEYTLELSEDGFNYYPTVTASVNGYSAISGQTANALNTENLDSGAYYCEITWDNGTTDTADDFVLTSDEVEYTAVDISFDANGGTDTMDAVKVEKGSEYALPANSFTAPNGYRFKGWATVADGEVIATDTITVNADTTLYAIWEKIPANAPVFETDVETEVECTYGDLDSVEVLPVYDDTNYVYTAQWYKNTVNQAVGGIAIDGATALSYQPDGDTAVGTYYYYCVVTATRRDNGETATATSGVCTYKINASNLTDDDKLTVKLSDDEFTYNGDEQKPTVTVSYNNKALTENTDYTLTWTTDCTNAGEKTVTINFKGNYNGTTQETFEIKQKEIGIDWGPTMFLPYNGMSKVPSATATGLVDGDTCTLTTEVVETAEGAGIIPGKWTAKVTALSNTNYKLPASEESITANFEIVTGNQNYAPNVTGVAETVKGKKDGTISGLTTEMEYATSLDGAYIKVTDSNMTFAAGTYYVRYSEKQYYNASPAKSVTIGEGRMLTVSVPQNQIGYTLTVDKTEIEYMGGPTITLIIHDGYSKTENFAVKLNGVDMQWGDFTQIDTQSCTEDVVITVEGIADITAPAAEISITESKWTSFWNSITFGLFFNETQDVVISATDLGSGIKSIQYYLANGELTLEEVKQITTWEDYDGAFKINPDNKYVVYAKVTDNAGNIKYLNSDGVVLDKTAAVISGVENGETYYGDTEVSVTDTLAGVKDVKVDGSAVTLDNGKFTIIADNAEHIIVVTDNSGNTVEYKVTVMKNYTVTYKADGETISTETVGHGKNANVPAVPAKDGYVGKWNADGKNITADTVIEVIYTAVPVVAPESVNLEDKSELEDTKKQLEDLLDDESYTEDDKKDIQDAIDSIDDALEVIENVENVEELIDKIPETITKNDEAAIKAADDAYNALTDYEKSLVDEDVKKALDDAKAALAELNKPTEPNSPQTGDNSNLWLWFALLFVSGMSGFGMMLFGRRSKFQK